MSHFFTDTANALVNADERPPAAPTRVSVSLPPIIPFDEVPDEEL